MTITPRVLVVDGLAETEIVLRAVLEPQGAAVERCRSDHADWSQSSRPQVMIVDGDNEAESKFWPDVPRVVLSSARLPDSPSSARFLEKPFHYPELVSLVRSLLDLPSEDRRLT